VELLQPRADAHVQLVVQPHLEGVEGALNRGHQMGRRGRCPCPAGGQAPRGGGGGGAK
jgi:hypothetical protein